MCKFDRPMADFPTTKVFPYITKILCQDKGQEVSWFRIPIQSSIWTIIERRTPKGFISICLKLKIEP